MKDLMKSFAEAVVIYTPKNNTITQKYRPNNPHLCPANFKKFIYKNLEIKKSFYNLAYTGKKQKEKKY